MTAGSDVSYLGLYSGCVYLWMIASCSPGRITCLGTKWEAQSDGRDERGRKGRPMHLGETEMMVLGGPVSLYSPYVLHDGATLPAEGWKWGNTL